MSELENDLKKALKRQSPPEGFTEAVLAKAQETKSGKPRFQYALNSAPLNRRIGSMSARLVHFVQLPRTRWAIAACALVVLLAAGTWQLWRSGAPTGSTVARQETASREGKQAKEQLMLALRITSAELREVQRRVAEAGDVLSSNGQHARDLDQGNRR